MPKLLDEVESRIGRIPASYKLAEWRNTTPVDGLTGRMGMGFDMKDGSVLRINISLQSARHLVDSIQEFLNSHSSMSSGIPSEPGSTPLEIEKV